MRRFLFFLLCAAGVHGGVIWFVAVWQGRACRPTRAPQVEIPAVELSFATREEADAIRETEADARGTRPSPAMPPVPPAVLPPPVFETPAAEPPEGRVTGRAVTLPVAEDSPPALPANVPSPASVSAKQAAVERAHEAARIDRAAAPKAAFHPAYPRAARRRGEEGVVTLDILVDALGGVSEVKVAVSSGFADLDRAAVKALDGMVFTPAETAGRAVASRVRLPVSFRLTP